MKKYITTDFIQDAISIGLTLWAISMVMGLTGCSSSGDPVESTLVTQQPLPTPPSVLNPLPGLLCEVYDLTGTNAQELPNFNPSQSQTILNTNQVNVGVPVSSFILTGGLDFTTPQEILAQTNLTQTTWFALDCVGSFTVNSITGYVFTLNSDDGSKLIIDGLTVVNNDGLHSAEAVSGDVIIDSGIHAVELQYFQGPGSAVLQLMSNQPINFTQP
jgi:hypothetical protein